MDFLKEFGINKINEELLNDALTHSSFANENHCNDYERLEFLGDAVLELCISDYLFNKKHIKEGKMSKLRSKYVCEDALCIYAESINLKDKIRVGNGLIGKINNTIIADVFEALLGAIYLSNNLSTCKLFIKNVVIPHIENNDDFFEDYKTILQEMVQVNQKTLNYDTRESEISTTQKKHFKSDVSVDGIILGSGQGNSKKIAEQNAAYDAILKSAR